jgi:DNA topoisomerase IA
MLLSFATEVSSNFISILLYFNLIFILFHSNLMFISLQADAEEELRELAEGKDKYQTLRDQFMQQREDALKQKTRASMLVEGNLKGRICVLKCMSGFFQSLTQIL